MGTRANELEFFAYIIQNKELWNFISDLLWYVSSNQININLIQYNSFIYKNMFHKINVGMCKM